MAKTKKTLSKRYPKTKKTIFYILILVGLVAAAIGIYFAVKALMDDSESDEVKLLKCSNCMTDNCKAEFDKILEGDPSDIDTLAFSTCVCNKCDCAGVDPKFTKEICDIISTGTEEIVNNIKSR